MTTASHSGARAGAGQATPRLNAILNRLGSRLRRGVWLHGVGTVVGCAALWLLFMYGADRILKLPVIIRLMHLAALALGTAWLVSRTYLAHRRRIPDRAGLAMMAQKALPDDVVRDDRFVSALELQGTVAADSPAAEFIARVTASAEDAAGKVDFGRILDGVGPVKRLAMGAVALAGTGAVLAANPEMTRIFAARMVGQDVSWPRETTLIVDVPADSGGLDVDRSAPDVIVVRAARGSDVPILATAEGVMPDLVTLTFDSGKVVDLGPSGPNTFRTRLPSVQDNMVLRLTGGDDRRGVPRIEIQVLQPPDLTGLAFAVEPPAYSGLPARLEEDTTVSVLEGSVVTVHILTDPADATGTAKTFPDNQSIALSALPYPIVRAVSEGSVDGAKDGAAAAPMGLGFREVAKESLRFQFQLQDPSGLKNPDPALFGIEVVPDRAPDLVMLDPGRADLEVVATGAVPVRLLAKDDFGVASMGLTLSDGQSEAVLKSIVLEATDVVAEPGDGPDRSQRRSSRVRSQKLGAHLVEIAQLFPENETPAAATIVLQARGSDARVPSPNETVGAPIRLRLVSADEFLRRQRDGLGRASADVTMVNSRLDKSVVTLETYSAAMSGDGAEAPDRARMVGTINDARRIQGDLEAVARDLSAIASSMIYSRLDGRSGALEARLFELTSGSADRAFQGAAWRTLSDELRGGQLGQPERAGDLVRVVSLALVAAMDRAGAWIESLEGVRAAEGLDANRAALGLATERITELQLAIEQLGIELNEWDSMQSIQALAREILSGHKNLTERTRKQAQSQTETEPGK